MPRLSPRQEPLYARDDELERTLGDAVVVNGVDAGAAHRAHMRSLTTAAQARERVAQHAWRQHQSDVMAGEAMRGHQRPRGAGWPATLRSVRAGKGEE